MGSLPPNAGKTLLPQTPIRNPSWNPILALLLGTRTPSALPTPDLFSTLLPLHGTADTAPRLLLKWSITTNLPVVKKFPLAENLLTSSKMVSDSLLRLLNTLPTRPGLVPSSVSANLLPTNSTKNAPRVSFSTLLNVTVGHGTSNTMTPNNSLSPGLMLWLPEKDMQALNTSMVL